MCRNLVISILFLIPVLSCTNNTEKFDNQKVEANSIVVIIDNYDSKSKLNFENGITIPAKTLLEFNNYPELSTKYNFKDSRNDTISLKLEKSFIEVYHRYNTIWEFKYYLRPGDTLILDYADDYPFGSLVNSKSKKFDINYDIMVNRLIYNDSIPAKIKLNFPMAFMNRSNDIRIEYQNVINENKIKSKAALIEETQLLDSLNDNNLINTTYHKNRIVSNYFDLLSFKIENEIKESYESIKKFPNNIIGFDSLILSNRTFDSLLNYSSYLNFIDKYISEKYANEIPNIKSKNSNYEDYRILYDSISNNNFLSSKTKEIVLYETLTAIIKNFPNTEAKEYYNYFKREFNESRFLSVLEDEHQLNQINVDDIELIDVKSNKTSLSNLLEKYKGKVLYLDFWASWCKPCIEVMPDSKTVADSLENYDIEFIYLSIDENLTAWQKATAKHKMGRNNFLIKNRSNSNFLDEIKLESIPRYLILDKSGKTYQLNAPGPNSKELINTLVNLASK
ncbi:TlpA disulfide reductase family protein [Marivirga tractuosa]|uniref:TlpA family protein disulfide reductase n=1 Tax=Marivirga tractuosa TaxID=1006 RepID=UPI0035D061F8